MGPWSVLHEDPMTATRGVISPAAGGLLAMSSFSVGLLWISETITNNHIPDWSFCMFGCPLDPLDCSLAFYVPVVVTNIYPGIFVDVGTVQDIWRLHKVYLKWSQIIRDMGFLVKMWLRNVKPEETKEKTVEKKLEEEAIIQRSSSVGSDRELE